MKGPPTQWMDGWMDGEREGRRNDPPYFHLSILLLLLLLLLLLVHALLVFCDKGGWPETNKATSSQACKHFGDVAIEGG